MNLLGGGEVSRIAADVASDGASHRVSDSNGANDEATAAVRVYPDDASPSGDDAKALAGGYELRGVVSHVGSSLAGGATGKDRVGPGIARAANEARARARTRATAPAGSIAATMRAAPACAACYERYARQAGVLMAGRWANTKRKVPT